MNNAELRLGLDDGTRMEGRAFGAAKVVRGEASSYRHDRVCGSPYRPHTRPDPVLTHPLAGHYGVPRPRGREADRPYESDRIQVQALVVQHYRRRLQPSRSARSLHEWLASEGVPGVTGIAPARSPGGCATRHDAGMDLPDVSHETMR